MRSYKARKHKQQKIDGHLTIFFLQMCQVKKVFVSSFEDKNLSYN